MTACLRAVATCPSLKLVDCNHSAEREVVGQALVCLDLFRFVR